MPVNSSKLLFFERQFGGKKIIGIFAKQFRIIVEMVVVAQLVEPWIVVPVVAGSSPVIHPYL